MFGMTTASRHWLGVATLFAFDAILVWVSFYLGSVIRFGEPAGELLLSTYLPGVLASSVILPSIFYIGGLYSTTRARAGIALIRWFILGIGVVGGVALAMGSIDFSSRIGRGVLATSWILLVILTAIHHIVLHRRWSSRWRTALSLVSSDADEGMARLLKRLWGGHAKLLGIITGGGFRPESDLTVLGDIEGLTGADSSTSADWMGKVDLILVRDRHLADPAFGPLLRQMRYQGVEIMSLADACEEAYGAVPLTLVTENWLFRACGQSDLFYIKKLKRGFDILTALCLIPVLSPLLLIGMAAVRLSSPGPVFFRQVRSGRLDRPFTILKLRTMHPEAESDGARWSSREDQRVFPVGRWLRQFRIDEIPQLLNVLRGDMSFVGPRPERPEFIQSLAGEIPWYRERLLVQPGLTGWAQVRYPYGASVEDAARKLEYDLYYMKHMSLLLDGFILLETIRTVFLGGVRPRASEPYDAFRSDLENPE